MFTLFIHFCVIRHFRSFFLCVSFGLFACVRAYYMKDRRRKNIFATINKGSAVISHSIFIYLFAIRVVRLLNWMRTYNVQMYDAYAEILAEWEKHIKNDHARTMQTVWDSLQHRRRDEIKDASNRQQQRQQQQQR